MGQHNCNDMISKVILALDGELTKEQESAFMAEISKCSCCLEHYNIEKSFKEFLANKLNHKCVDANLINAIKNNLGSSSNHKP